MPRVRSRGSVIVDVDEVVKATQWVGKEECLSASKKTGQESGRNAEECNGMPPKNNERGLGVACCLLCKLRW
jgi:hypothetical protein